MKEYSQQWAVELEILKNIIKKSGLTETIKWGIEIYTYRGRNVVGLTGFKDFFALWFYNGVFLKDDENVLITASDGKTKALRQWRFKSKDEIREDLIMRYIHEAVLNEEARRYIKPQKSAMPPVPELLQSLFDSNEDLKTNFEKLTPFRQKEYIEYINTPKKEETRIARAQKSVEMILQGKGLNDKYR